MFALAFLPSCKKGGAAGTLILNGGSATVDASFAGESLSLRMYCDCKWKISGGANWFQVKNVEGDGAGVLKLFTVAIDVSANDSGKPREAGLKVSYGASGQVKELTLRQGAAGSLKPCTASSITDDMLFSTAPAGTTTAVQQGFEISPDKSTMYFTQVNSRYKNIVAWTPRKVTDSKDVAANRMTLYYYSHSNNIHLEQDGGNDYIWLGNWGTRTTESKYTDPQVLSRIKLTKGATLRPEDADDNYYFGTRTLHASFDVANDRIAIYSQRDGYTMKIYRLSDVLATPVSNVTLKYEIVNGGSEAGFTSPDPEYRGKPTIKAHDCRSLTPLKTFVYNYTSTCGWQTFCLSGDRIYFFLENKQMDPAPNGMHFQSVINVLDLDGNVLKSGILQPFADNMDDLLKYGFTDSKAKYMEAEGILVRGGVLYLLYSGKDDSGFTRPIIFQLSTSGL